MKSFCTFILTLTVGSLLFSGCASDKPSTAANTPSPTESTAVAETTTTTTTTTSTDATAPAMTEAAVPTDDGSGQPIPLSKLPTKKGYPYAIKTKWPDRVKSPYAQDRSTLVNVEGMGSGTFARCPFTGKIFVVP